MHAGENLSTITIRLSARKDDDHLRIECEDDGQGIPPERRDEIFEKYHTDHREGSTGLGLASLWDFIKGIGGTRLVQDAPGGGALFVLQVPLLHGASKRPPD